MGAQLLSRYTKQSGLIKGQGQKASGRSLKVAKATVRTHMSLAVLRGAIFMPAHSLVCTSENCEECQVNE